ncbi:uncharacterized protein LOC143042452 isoform X2 [Mytilus galloprovincialis]|uniref:uncharacterized protein LOC143042452 isoform X2 n=1 Tax=Mytilus galloprovincialis TaxID=29158 RepID=UPI003F7B75FA
MFLKGFIFVYIIFANMKKCATTHFRGGTISWKYLYTSNEVEITYRLTFRRGAFERHECNDSTIINGDLVTGEGSLQCISGCSNIATIVPSMNYYCTDYSVDEDWTSGQDSTTYTFSATTTNVFHFGYQACCWITLVEANDGDTTSAYWSLLTTANLTTRIDTGKINISPISAMQPILRLKQGCSYSIKIPVADDDGDIVRCRWSTKSPDDECGEVCNTLSTSIINEDDCVLQYTASGSTGWYAVALQIEDYATSIDTKPMSSVALQFMIYVLNSTELCDDAPNVLNLMNDNGTVASIALNSSFFQTIIADSGSTSVSISEITTVSPIGMIKTHLLPYGSSGTQWHINVTWTPSESQTGSHIFCYTAVNNFGQASIPTCTTIEVDDVDDCASNPCKQGGTCNNHVSRYSCTCPLSHTGKQCETEIDFCQGVPCQNGGTCIDGLFTYTCNCAEYHTGVHCETDTKLCDGISCGNGGTCLDGVLNYTCSCPDSHTGIHCETDINFCEGISCGNIGTCLDGVLNYTCSCPDSHTGIHCETDINFCEGIACENGGTCLDGMLNYTCSCPDSHTGTLCKTDINFCEGITCRHGGTCVDGVLDYTCACPDSHTGGHCETDIDFCELVPCENNGTCVDGLFNCTCICPLSHTSFYCESDIDFCKLKDLPCHNGGTCVDGLFFYTCICPLTHTGDHCETEANNTGYVLSVVFVSVGLVLSGIMTGVLIKSSVSYLKGTGGSIDTYNPLYM